MFESALIRRPGLIDGRYDVGRVFETLLYYQRVHLVLDLQFLSGLVDAIELQGLRDVLALPHVTADLVAPGMAAMHTNSGSGLATHKPIFATYLGKKASHKAVESIHNFLTNQPKTKSLKLPVVRETLRQLKPTTYSALLGPEPQSNQYFRSLIEDRETIAEVIRRKAASSASFLPQRLEAFEHTIIGTDVGFTVGSPGWDALFADRSPPEGLTWGAVLATVFEYSMDLQLAAEVSTDVIVDDEASSLATSRIDLALKRAAKSQANISAFEDLVFEEARYFRGAVNDGSLTTAQALSIIEKSADMRKWVGGVSPTSDLAKEYVRSVSEQPALERIDASVIRFSGFTGAGVLLDIAGAGGLGTALGVAISAFDQFLLKKLVGGWRPNTFVSRVKKG